METIRDYLVQRRAKVESALDRLLPRPEGDFSRHIEAMRYSLFVGGKRVRPILCLAAAECVSNDPDVEQRVMGVACALECIHTYSLIHDDLPAMDDDDLRRGKPTCHKKFGEAEAILAGDGLLTLAFDLLAGEATAALPDPVRLQIIRTIARAAGSMGMVGGQSLDIDAEGRRIDFDALRTIHRAKTGALITAAVETGALAGGADDHRLQALVNYGQAIGLAFQIVDDLLDVTATTEELGKPAGSDTRHNKATYPAFFGVERTREMAAKAAAEAEEALAPFDDRAEPLRSLARYIVERSR